MLSLHQLALSFGTFGRDAPVIPETPPPLCQGLKATNCPGGGTDAVCSARAAVRPARVPRRHVFRQGAATRSSWTLPRFSGGPVEPNSAGSSSNRE